MKKIILCIICIVFFNNAVKSISRLFDLNSVLNGNESIAYQSGELTGLVIRIIGSLAVCTLIFKYWNAQYLRDK
jgi:hypothetical protein